MKFMEKLLVGEKVEWKKLGEIGEFYGGITGKKKEDFQNGNAVFITYKNVYNNLSLKIDVEDRVKIYEGEKQRKLQYGDIVFTGSSEKLNECGISSVVTEKPSEDLYLNSFCFFLRLDVANVLLPDFSKYLFRSEKLRYQIIKTASGVTRFNVSKEMMKKIEIPIPSIETQEKIVKILDNFTKCVTELQAELQARNKQYNYYRDMLLSEDYLNKISEKLVSLNNENYVLRLTTLGEVGKVSMCRRILKNQTTSNGEVPFYKIGTFGKKADSFISKSLFEEYKSRYSFPKKGDILISASGTIGRTVIYNGEDAYFQDSNIVWIDNDETVVKNKYLYYFYSTNPWKISNGGTISRIYNKDIEKIKIFVPPIEIQNKIVKILDRFQELLSDTKGLLPLEIEQRRKQYEYYREKLLTFDKEEGYALSTAQHSTAQHSDK